MNDRGILIGKLNSSTNHNYDYHCMDAGTWIPVYVVRTPYYTIATGTIMLR